MIRFRPIFLFVIICFAHIKAQEKEWETQAELSYVQTSGNSTSQTASAKLDFNGNISKNRYLLRAMFLTARDEGKEKASKLTGLLRYERVFSGRIFGFMEMGYLRDRFAGYEHRLSAGPGIGIDIIHTKKHILKSLLSGMYTFESYTVELLETDHFTTVKTALNYEWNIRENTTLKTGVDYSTSLENQDKYYFNGESSLSVGISSRISIGVSYLVNYQNLVPSPEIKSTDTSFLTSIILSLS